MPLVSVGLAGSTRDSSGKVTNWESDSLVGPAGKLCQEFCGRCKVNAKVNCCLCCVLPCMDSGVLDVSYGLRCHKDENQPQLGRSRYQSRTYSFKKKKTNSYPLRTFQFLKNQRSKISLLRWFCFIFMTTCSRLVHQNLFAFLVDPFAPC